MNITDYQLGILWSIGSHDKTSNRIVFRHKERYFIEQIQSFTSGSIYFQKDKNKEQYALYTSSLDIEKMKSMNWTERKSYTRILPVLDDYKNFLRAYIEIHSRLDYSTRYAWRNKRKKYKGLRLRIYGNIHILEEINIILNQNVGVGLKALEILKNNKTGILCYTSFQQIESIYRYIEDEPCFETYWFDVYEKFKNPRIEV